MVRSPSARYPNIVPGFRPSCLTSCPWHICCFRRFRSTAAWRGCVIVFASRVCRVSQAKATLIKEGVMIKHQNKALTLGDAAQRNCRRVESRHCSARQRYSMQHAPLTALLPNPGVVAALGSADHRHDFVVGCHAQQQRQNRPGGPVAPAYLARAALPTSREATKQQGVVAVHGHGFPFAAHPLSFGNSIGYTSTRAEYPLSGAAF